MSDEQETQEKAREGASDGASDEASGKIPDAAPAETREGAPEKASEEPPGEIKIVHPSAKNPDPHGVYIDEVQSHQRRYRSVVQFTGSSTRAAMIMLLAAIAALIVANVGAHGPFMSFWNMEVTIGIGGFEAEMSLAHIINDILMALFFLLVGLEIKYEMTVGELTNIRQAALPIIAAAGGVMVPIVIYLLFNASHPEASHGWGVPTATDIAFALGIMALLGDRAPNGLRVFLSTLAVADDIIAILVIAIFYGESPSFLWLALAAVVFVALILLNRAHVYSLFPYIVGGILLWICIYLSGIHSTIAGVLLAFTIPSGSHVKLRTFLTWSHDRVREADSVYEDDTPVIAQGEYIKTVERITRVSRQVVPPATRLEHKLYPWVYFAILPLFALTNADVELVGNDVGAMFTSSVTFGVFFGLLLGKPIGIMLLSFLTVKLKIANLPAHVNWMHMLGAAILGGVGFTMAIFVANLAYTDDFLISEAKLGILSASLVSGVIGFLFLFMQARRTDSSDLSSTADRDGDPSLIEDDAEVVEVMQESVASAVPAEEARSGRATGDAQGASSDREPA